MTVYLDVLWLVNLVMDYLILLAVARLTATYISRLRLLLGATFGAFYAVSTVFWSALSGVIPMLVCGFLMVFIVFSAYRPRMLRIYLVFLLIAGAFAGIAIAVGQMSGAMLRVGGGYYLQVPLRVVLPSACLCYVASGWLLRGMGAPQQLETVCITLEGRTQTYALLCDTGNQLCDPMTGKPALVLGRGAVARLFPVELIPSLLALQTQSAVQVYSTLPMTWRSRFVLLPYRTAGEDGMLLAFRPDAITRAGKAYTALVAIGKTEFEGRYEGLIGGFS